jgi:hypothetical protein
LGSARASKLLCLRQDEKVFSLSIRQLAERWKITRDGSRDSPAGELDRASKFFKIKNKKTSSFYYLFTGRNISLIILNVKMGRQMKITTPAKVSPIIRIPSSM